MCRVVELWATYEGQTPREELSSFPRAHLSSGTYEEESHRHPRCQVTPRGLILPEPKLGSGENLWDDLSRHSFGETPSWQAEHLVELIVKDVSANIMGRASLRD